METTSSHRFNTTQRAGASKQSSCQHKRTHVLGGTVTPQSFLTETIGDIRAIDILNGTLAFENASYCDKTNVANLISATRQWFRLHNLPMPEISGKDTFDVIQRCFQQISPHLPEGHSLSIDYSYKENAFVLIEYARCKFPSCTVFHFPLSSLESYKGKIRTILRDFVALMYHHTPYSWPEDSYDFSLLFDVFEEEDYNEEIKEIIDIYKNGSFKKLQDEVLSVKPEGLGKRILSQIESLSTKDKKKYANLISAIGCGVPILMEDSISSYRFFPDDCTLPEFSNEDNDGLLTLDRLFVICYDTDEHNDPLFDSALTSISEEANNIEAEEVMDYHIISSKDDKAFSASTYPSRWVEWFNTFIQIIENNEQAVTDSE